ncbi:MAG TPA: hypothetical protein VGD71_18255 [Kribbella sp.]
MPIDSQPSGERRIAGTGPTRGPTLHVASHGPAEGRRARWVGGQPAPAGSATPWWPAVGGPLPTRPPRCQAGGCTSTALTSEDTQPGERVAGLPEEAPDRTPVLKDYEDFRTHHGLRILGTE